jgi:cupin fold WbuC family metalloprotein
LDPRAETLFALSGVFALFVFDDAGQVTTCRLFGSEHYFQEKEMALGVEISPVEWHTVIALRDDSVLLEIKAGPFDPQVAKEFATWAPEEGAQDAATYLKQLGSIAVAQGFL